MSLHSRLSDNDKKALDQVILKHLNAAPAGHLPAALAFAQKAAVDGYGEVETIRRRYEEVLAMDGTERAALKDL